MNENNSLPNEVEDKPNSSKPYLDMIVQAEKAFSTWQDKADSIDKIYADLERQANPNRDRQMAVFWANIQVLAPSIYSRPPVPVVVPRFRDRDPVKNKASEILERATIVTFEQEAIDEVMRMVRDDLTLPGRGVPWVRLKERDGKDYVCIEHLDRKDFLHEPARKWKEVQWVARRGWLTKDAMRKRFGNEKAQEAAYNVRKDDRNNGAADNTEQCGVWEIWHKEENKVIWVTEGVDTVLDIDDPHLKLDGFFPCPKPAYATVQRGSLIPVPDMVYYKDQLEEINELTNRIGALAQAVKVKGFYAAGAAEAGDAIETALKAVGDNQIMVPVSNFAAFGSGGDLIVWLPIDMIVTTIASLVELRQQLITDVYEITGLSDIMRGNTDSAETATAQQLKSQYGSVRIRDKQHELVRVARDITRIVAEVMAENYDPDVLMAMSQVELPTNADLDKRAQQIMQSAEQQVIQGQQQLQQAMQQQPEAAQQMQQQAEQMLQELEQQTQAQIDELEQQPTVEKVMALFREQRLRPFILDIETDSTIQPDEDAEKQRRAEFLQALGGTLQQLAPMVQQQPSTAGFAGEILKFALAPYRAGRELEASVDEFVEQMKQQVGQEQPNPEAEKAKAEAEMKQQELQMRQEEAKAKLELEREKMMADQQGKQLEAGLKQQEAEAKLAQIQAQTQRDEQKGQLELQKIAMELEAKQQELAIKRESAQIDAAAKVQQAEISAASAEQQADLKERDAATKERMAAQKTQGAE